MSANHAGARAPADARPGEPSSINTGSTAAPNAASASSNGPREVTLSTGESTGAASHESPPPPPPDTEDEETESEVEIDLEMDDATAPAPSPGFSPPPPPPLETPPPHVHNPEPELDEPDSEEEDEEFPPVALTPRGSQVDEETKGGEEDEEEEVAATAPRPTPAVRRVEVEERKQEGDDDEAEDADEGDPSYEEDDGEPRRAAGGRREKTRVDVEPDTELLRLMAAEAGRMAAAEKKMPVWNDLAQKLSHRFRSGRALQARVGWLQVVLRDPSHGEYEHVTDEMKKLMKVYHVATGSVKPPRSSPKRRTIIGFKDPAKRRKLGRTDKPSLEERLQSSTSPKPAAKPSPDNRSADSSTPKAGSGPGTPKNNQDEPTLDAVAEEKLMRMVVSLAPEFVSAEDKMDVWTKIAAASRGRYSSGIRVRAHARWLVKVFRDPTHREHCNLTPALKDLITKFLRATDQPLVASGPTTPRANNDKAASGTSNARDQNSKVSEEKSVPKRPKKVTIRPNGDSSLMQLVLEKRPFAASSTTTASIWTDIAAAMGQTHPKITDGPSALARLNTILKVFNDASHPNHNDFTKRLREQLSSYNQIVASFRANLNVLKRRVLHDDSSEASAEDVKIAKPRALGEGADIGVAPKPSLEKPRRTSRSAAIASASPSENTIELDSVGYTGRKPIVPLNVEADELLLRVLLEKQPWTADRTQQGSLWKEVAAAVQDLNPRIWNGVSAIGRVRWLQKVVSTPSHSDHGRLTSPLRSMLKEFEELYGKRSDTLSEQGRPPNSLESSENDSVQSLISKKRKEAVVTEASENAEPDLPDGKRVRHDSANEGGATASNTSAKGETSSDETLLWWALQARPFHSKRGDGMAAWDEVAVAADQALGQPTFRTGGRALSRLKRLLSAFRNPNGTPDIQLNERQRKMAELVATLLNTKWPSDETNLTENHRHLQERIRQMLEEKTAVKANPTQTVNGVDTKVLGTAITNGGAAVAQKGPSAADASDDDFEMVILPRSEKELAELRSKLAEVNKQCNQLRAELESKKALDVQAKLRRDQVNALQDEVIRLRSAAASDRASFETQLQTLHGEITSYRAQLASQAKRLDQERQDHRDELRGIVAMLQSERAAHERDTATMLDVVHREREDRREEFVAMMNLVTRSVLQAEPAATLP